LEQSGSAKTGGRYLRRRPWFFPAMRNVCSHLSGCKPPYLEVSIDEGSSKMDALQWKIMEFEWMIWGPRKPENLGGS